jgi:ElaB/YqjD/DUF883 family membrane-anchored ribosome-binding protein
MAHRTGIREELDALRAEIMALRHKTESAGTPHGDAEPAGGAAATLEHQITELNRLVKTMLDEAETTVIEHPVATVAGALALGIVIGRLTAR